MVYDIQEGTGKYVGMMGALLVYWIPPDRKETVTFKIGTGFSDAERENPPKVGQVVKFSYQEVTVAGVPRFPAYLGLME
jgi:DNA ligase-1